MIMFEAKTQCLHQNILKSSEKIVSNENGATGELNLDLDKEETKEHEYMHVPMRNAYMKRVQLRRVAACETARKRRNEE